MATKVKKHSPKILVLGAKGMLGQAVFRVLHEAYPATVWGTDRTDRKFFKFEAATAEKSLAQILKKTGKLEFIINCIGVLRGKEETEGLLQQFILANAQLPHILAAQAKKHGCRLIHISTDAVFPANSKQVVELSVAVPDDAYGMSKLLGEPAAPNAITVRSSIIGLDKYKHKGIVEWVMSQHEKTIDGYFNQQWNGCTTLQLAELCRSLIEVKTFDTLRKKSAVLHFAPLQTTKYTLIKTIRITLGDTALIRRVKGAPISRSLQTHWKSLLPMSEFYKGSVNQAISDLLI